MNTTKIKWRLANRPTPDEVSQLFSIGLLTKDEAREILISQETEDDRTKESLQQEIKFLRELVQRLSSNPQVIYRTIETIKTPYLTTSWFPAYNAYTSGLTTQAGMTNAVYVAGGAGGSGANASNAVFTVASGGSSGTTSLSAQSGQTSTPLSFTSIKTF